MTMQKKMSLPLVVIQVVFFVLVVPLMPLLISGRWSWWEAWVYAAICIVGFAASRALAAKQHPAILAERARMLQHTDTKPWDKVLAPLVGIGGGLVPLVVGIEARFAQQVDFGQVIKFAALIFILSGYVLSAWALIENRFFSGVVRIQTERGHTVISSGPYRWLRHPGYAGALLAYMGTPFLLDSAWALLPALFLLVVLVVRTALEDRTLQAELPGYREYAAQVRYRLLPGIW